MKFTLLIFATCAIVASKALTKEESDAQLEANKKICLAESQVDSQVLENGRKGIFGRDKNLMKYYYCMLRKDNFIDENGVLKVDVIEAELPSDIGHEDTSKALEACKNEKGTDKYETAQLVYQCYLKVLPNAPIFY